MRGWYLERDLLPGVDEWIVPETSSLEATVERITHEMFPELEHLRA